MVDVFNQKVEVLSEEEKLKEAFKDNDAFEIARLLVDHVIDYETTYSDDISLMPSKFDRILEIKTLKDFLEDDTNRKKVESRLYEDFSNYANTNGISKDTEKYLYNLVKTGNLLHDYNQQQDLKQDKENESTYKVNIYETEEDYDRGEPFTYQLDSYADLNTEKDNLIETIKYNGYYSGNIVNTKTDKEEFYVDYEGIYNLEDEEEDEL